MADAWSRAATLGGPYRWCRVIVGTLVQHLDLELLPGATVPKRSGIAFQPPNQLEVRVLERRAAQARS